MPFSAADISAYNHVDKKINASLQWLMMTCRSSRWHSEGTQSPTLYSGTGSREPLSACFDKLPTYCQQMLGAKKSGRVRYVQKLCLYIILNWSWLCDVFLFVWFCTMVQKPFSFFFSFSGVCDVFVNTIWDYYYRSNIRLWEMWCIFLSERGGNCTEYYLQDIFTKAIATDSSS